MDKTLALVLLLSPLNFTNIKNLIKVRGYGGNSLITNFPFMQNLINRGGLFLTYTTHAKPLSLMKISNTRKEHNFLFRSYLENKYANNIANLRNAFLKQNPKLAQRITNRKAREQPVIGLNRNAQFAANNAARLAMYGRI
jgi:hypothetical protein